MAMQFVENCFPDQLVSIQGPEKIDVIELIVQDSLGVEARPKMLLQKIHILKEKNKFIKNCLGTYSNFLTYGSASQSFSAQASINLSSVGTLVKL